MKSFQAKIGQKRVGKRENKRLSFRFVPNQCVIEKFQKKKKKILKIKKHYYEFISSHTRLEKDEKQRK